MQSGNQNMQEKQESLQKQRDQQNKDRGRKIVPYTGFLTPKNQSSLKKGTKKTPRKKVPQGKSAR